MKIVHLLVLVMVFELFAMHAAFAKTNNVYKAVASQKSGKPGGTPGAKKNSSRITGTGFSGTKKNSSVINGTGIHHKR